ncbi:Na+/H+ antiporter NhaC family protein [Alkalihalobacterium chitinilyticum]|uniref:Na+/H+ antiporter NhaC family protein n=1 Tax=Alkalihalobacterium chitinilyticum TaxID=2980103 RepID=A0ABT5VIN7_9BACI|nr:Na+/H+ antiporter NhaC family protein [Alkalihalobacterium chitinilyticum]MDE5415316.1 Na+/H+ antiporter NhaC family protein [Alkalihalobacterium chitinilyticum]
METSILSLIPPVLALVLVIVTRRVLISLGAGIIAGALLLNGFDPISSLTQIFTIVAAIFYVDGAINDWELYIIFFLLLLGMLASLIALSGGSRAFGEWALQRVKTRVGAQLVTVVLGIIIFIDDYFNSLTVGNVSRPLTDRHRISRAKLAYLVDSTSAPMCVISPISSWGAYIIAIIGGILMTHSVTQYQALQAFLIIVPMNYYALFAVLLVLAVAWFKLDFGAMKKHERLAIETGEVVDKAKGTPPGENMDVQPVENGKVRDLVLPIITLIVGTVLFMIITGIQGTEGTATLLEIFENTDVAAALVYGGLLGLAAAVILTLSKKVAAKDFGIGLWAGIKSMLPAIYILIFAWTIIEIIGDLGTGAYLATLIDGNIPLALLPVIIFIVAGAMAFSTGTSWGTFGMMLPIAGDIAATLDITMLLPMLAAVLAGAIFGDHCSPISDTTILSSTGAGSHHIDHVITQLPYALLVALISIVGFLVLGITGSMLIGFIAAFGAFIVTVIVLKKIV